MNLWAQTKVVINSLLLVVAAAALKNEEIGAYSDMGWWLKEVVPSSSNIR